MLRLTHNDEERDDESDETTKKRDSGSKDGSRRRKHRQHKHRTSTDSHNVSEYVYRYEGMFANDMRDGEGVLIENVTVARPQGSCRYEGHWSFGRRHGKGVQTDAVGVYEGIWVCLLKFVRKI